VTGPALGEAPTDKVDVASRQERADDGDELEEHQHGRHERLDEESDEGAS
jgi:hypothetical protein